MPGACLCLRRGPFGVIKLDGNNRPVDGRYQWLCEEHRRKDKLQQKEIHAYQRKAVEGSLMAFGTWLAERGADQMKISEMTREQVIAMLCEYVLIYEATMNKQLLNDDEIPF